MNRTVRWAPVTTVSPSPRCGRVELDNPDAHARVHLDRDALARLLAGRAVPEAATKTLTQRGLLLEPAEDLGSDEDPRSRGRRAWREHGWGLSLSFYLWSRRANFVDEGAEAEQRRRSALERMLAEAPLPARASPAEHDTAMRRLDEVAVPGPDTSLGDTLCRRRSVLRPHGPALKLVELLDWLRHGAAALISARAVSDRPREPIDLLVSYGSALELYVLIYRSPDLPAGVYRLDPAVPGLQTVREADVLEAAREALLRHPDCRDAAATVAVVADFPQYQWRYRHERALRNLWVEAGRVTQDLLIAATARGMPTGITPALEDTAFLELLGLAGQNCQVLHTITVSGGPRRDAPGEP